MIYFLLYPLLNYLLINGHCCASGISDSYMTHHVFLRALKTSCSARLVRGWEVYT